MKQGIVLGALGVLGIGVAVAWVNPFVAQHDAVHGSAAEPTSSQQRSGFAASAQATRLAAGAPGEAYTLSPLRTLATSGPLGPVAIGDVTGDGRDDVVTLVDRDSYETSLPGPAGAALIYVQQPDGSLAEPVVQPYWSMHTASSLLLADMNNDSVKDIVIGHDLGWSVLLANGQGGFLEIRTADVTLSGAADVADVDIDGYPDLAVMSYSLNRETMIYSEQIVVFYGDGQGGFRERRVVDPRRHVSDLQLADLNGDGMVDLLLQPGTGDEFLVRLNVGAGQFADAKSYRTSWSGQGAVAADLDGDGSNEVIVSHFANPPRAGLSVFNRNDNAAMTFAYELPSGDLPSFLEAADLDGDGRVDLLTKHHGGAVGFSLNRAEGFLDEQRLTVFANVFNQHSFAVGDINNDGCTDLAIVSDGDSGTKSLSLYTGSGCKARAPAAIRDDVDGDGDTDLLWRNDGKTDFACWLMQGAQRPYGVGYSVGPAWNVIAKGDFNGDGTLDLVWSDGHDMQLWQRYGDSYQGWVMPAYPQGYRVVATGDVDGDGNADLLWRDRENTQLALWTMDGAWVKQGKAYGFPPSWRVAASGDLNGDGRMDLIISNGTRMDLWQGQRNLVWQPAAMGGYPAGWDLTGAADIDGDGKSDLLWRHAELGYFVQWRMVGPRRTWGREYRVDGSWRVLTHGDYNADGKADFVWTNGTLMQLWASGEGDGYAGLEMPDYPRGWNVQ